MDEAGTDDPERRPAVAAVIRPARPEDVTFDEASVDDIFRD